LRSKKTQETSIVFQKNKLAYYVLGICDVGAFIERQTNQQQMPFFEKQMYSTLFVCPNITKPYCCMYTHSTLWSKFGNVCLPKCGWEALGK